MNNSILDFGPLEDSNDYRSKIAAREAWANLLDAYRYKHNTERELSDRYNQEQRRFGQDAQGAYYWNVRDQGQDYPYGESRNAQREDVYHAERDQKELRDLFERYGRFGRWQK